MKNFCIYNGKKILKPEIWNITSIELSGDYTSAIIQAESKVSTSQYTLDITLLISNQYKNGIDPYSSTIVNELTGVSDWTLDSANNQIKYYEPSPLDPNYQYKYLNLLYDSIGQVAQRYIDDYNKGKLENASNRFIRYFNCAVGGNGYLVCSFEYKGGGSTNFQVAQRVPRTQEIEREEKSIPLETVAQQVISNAESGDTQAQQAIVSTFNNITDGILTSDYSEFFEQNKQPK